MPAEKNDSVFRKPENPNIKVWRYMDFTKFVSLLDRKVLYFSRADLFGDAFEGAMPRRNDRYYSLDGINPYTPERSKALSEIRERVRKNVFMNCWHMNERESAAMWKLYARSNEAIAIQTTFQALHNCLPPKTHLGAVQYIDYENDFIPEDSFLRPFMYKRKSFEHEREVRALIYTRPEDSESYVGYAFEDIGRTVPVKLNDLIETVYVAPTSTKWFVSLVESVMKKYQLDKRPVLSSLDEKPVF